MSEEKFVVVAIDPQKDFLDIEGASLPVPGSSLDMRRLARFISVFAAKISRIIITLDSHRVVHIAHTSGWVNADGVPVDKKGMIPISHQDTLDGKYVWTIDPEWGKEYTRRMEASAPGSVHFLWPDHCVVGTWGHAIFPELADAIHAWEREYGGLRGAEYIQKGANPKTEHFGAFGAQVAIDGEPDTQLKTELLESLADGEETVVLAGEALSHCLSTSLDQMLNFSPDLAKRLVILEDCTSDVVGFEGHAKPILDRARSMGAKFAKSTDFIDQLPPTAV